MDHRGAMKSAITSEYPRVDFMNWDTDSSEYDKNGGMRIEDSVVAVTGGASGLGEAVARRCIDQGAAGVAILDVNADAATSLASELGDRAFALPCDVRQPSDVTQAMSTMAEKFGRLNLRGLVRGVGWAERTLAKDGSPADLDASPTIIIEINLIGTYDFARQAASLMAKNEPDASGERGAIVMTASLAAFDGQDWSIRVQRQQGLVGMTLPMSRDLAPVGVRVMTIAPGLTQDTPIYDPVGGAELKERLVGLTVFPNRLGAAMSTPTFVQAIAENSYLNGETIRHDAATRLLLRADLTRGRLG